MATITPISITIDVPDYSTATSQLEFNTDATAFAGDLKEIAEEILPTFITETNALRGEVVAANSSALAARDLAEDWAEKAEDVEVETGKYSAKHYALSAEDWAEEAENVEVETGAYSAKHHALKAESFRDSTETIAAAVEDAAGIPSMTGSAGFTLTVNDDEAGVSWQNKCNVQDFAASGTWTKPSGATVVTVELLGAGAGGQSGSSAAQGRGGGGGGYIKRQFRAADIPSTVSVVIGSGGTGGTGGTGDSGAYGTNGGNTEFGLSGDPLGVLAKAIAGNHNGSGGSYGPVDQLLYHPYSGGGSNQSSCHGGPGGGPGAIQGGSGYDGGAVNDYYNDPKPNNRGADGGTGPGGDGGDGVLVVSAARLAGNGGGGGGSTNASSGMNGGNGGNGGRGAGGGGGGTGDGTGSTLGGNGGNGGDGYARITTW